MEKILQNLWKTSLVLELLCCFRIAGEISFFRPLSLGALFHRENTVMNPQNTKCHRSPNIIFFRYFWYFSITKAIYSYALAKFEQISIFFYFQHLCSIFTDDHVVCLLIRSFKTSFSFNRQYHSLPTSALCRFGRLNCSVENFAADFFKNFHHMCNIVNRFVQ